MSDSHQGGREKKPIRPPLRLPIDPVSLPNCHSGGTLMPDQLTDVRKVLLQASNDHDSVENLSKPVSAVAEQAYRSLKSEFSRDSEILALLDLYYCYHRNLR
jgi:hypothetical protein